MKHHSAIAAGLFAIVATVVVSAEPFKLYADFAPLQIPNTQGCPLAGVWTLGSDYPLNNVDGPLQDTNVKFSAPSSCSKEQFDDIATKVLADFEQGNVGTAPHNRNIFHAAGTYSAVAGAGAIGGVNGGWIRFQNNLDFAENAGLQGAVAYLEALVEEYPCITFADAIVFVGVIMTEASGGPAVAFMPGRRDADKTPQNPLIATRLPDATFTSSGVVYFYTQMGLTDREIAVINGGGHSIGGASPKNSGWNGSFTPTGDFWPTPKNLYFVQTFEENWVPQITNQQSDKAIRLQYVLVDQNNEPVLDNGGAYIIRIPSDVAILLDGRAPTAWAYSYYEDENLFMEDYARTLQRISQLGNGDWSLNQTQYEWLGINGTATNYGVDMEPLAGDPPVSVSDIQYPQWVIDLREKSGPLFTLADTPASPPSETSQSPETSHSATPMVAASCLFGAIAMILLF